MHSKITYSFPAAHFPPIFLRFRDCLTHCHLPRSTIIPLLFTIISTRFRWPIACRTPHCDNFPAQSGADLLIDTSGYLVLEVTPWTTQYLPKYPDWPTYCSVIPVTYCRHFYGLLLDFRRLIDRRIPLSSSVHISLLFFKPQWLNPGMMSLDSSSRSWPGRTTIRSGLGRCVILLGLQDFGTTTSRTKKIISQWPFFLKTRGLEEDVKLERQNYRLYQK